MYIYNTFAEIVGGPFGVDLIAVHAFNQFMLMCQILSMTDCKSTADHLQRGIGHCWTSETICGHDSYSVIIDHFPQLPEDRSKTYFQIICVCITKPRQWILSMILYSVTLIYDSSGGQASYAFNREKP